MVRVLRFCGRDCLGDRFGRDRFGDRFGRDCLGGRWRDCLGGRWRDRFGERVLADLPMVFECLFSKKNVGAARRRPLAPSRPMSRHATIKVMI